MGAQVDEAFIRRAVEMADLAAVRVALYQATHDPEIESLRPVAQLEAEDREKLISKAVHYLQHEAAGVTLSRPNEVELQHLMLAGTELPASERAELRQALLRYCERDTWAMVKMLEKLRGLVADQLELF